MVAVFKLGWSLVFFKAERRYNDDHKSTRSILPLQPRDKAAMLVVNTKEIFLLNLHQNRVHFPAERNAFVLDHQHGRRDVTCKPAIVERIIGILKKRWACLMELRFKPGKYCEVIVVCCILHNFCRDLPLHDDDDDDDNDDDDDYDCQEETDETVEGREYRVEFIQSFFS